MRDTTDPLSLYVLISQRSRDVTLENRRCPPPQSSSLIFFFFGGGDGGGEGCTPAERSILTSLLVASRNLQQPTAGTIEALPRTGAQNLSEQIQNQRSSCSYPSCQTSKFPVQEKMKRKLYMKSRQMERWDTSLRPASISSLSIV